MVLLNFFNNLKLGTKITSGFFVVAILAFAIGIVGISRIKVISNNDTELYKEMTAPMSNVVNMAESFQKIRVDLRDVLLASNANAIPEYETKYNTDKENFSKNYLAFQETVHTNEGKALCEKLDKSMTYFEQLVSQIIQLKKENKDQQAFDIIKGEGVKANAAVDENLAEIIDMKESLAKTTANDNAAMASSATSLMIIIMILGVLAAIGLGVLISRAITKPISKLVDYSNRIAVGDIDINIENITKDEIGDLMSAFKKMTENINEQVNAVEKIASGDLNINLSAKSDKDVLGKNIVLMAKTIEELLTEIRKLINAIQEGKLRIRGDFCKLQWGVE